MTASRPNSRCALQVVPGIAMLLGLAGCAGSPPRTPVVFASSASSAIPTPAPRAPIQGVAQALERHYASWRRVPYAYGGTRSSGIDCSGFVLAAYAELFGIRLPRTTAALRTVGRDVTGQPPRAGDLVFFSIDGKDSHVGIYSGHGAFVHASTRRGVTRDRLDSPYWSKRYSGSVRVLPEGHASVES